MQNNSYKGIITGANYFVIKTFYPNSINLFYQLYIFIGIPGVSYKGKPK